MKFGESLLPFISFHFSPVQKVLFPWLVSKSKKVNTFKIIILPVVVYGCEPWSLTVGEERRLRVFVNRVLRRIFGPKREEVVGDWRKLHNEVFHNLYFSAGAGNFSVYHRVQNGSGAHSQVDAGFFPWG
jgi:hypothetical protein